MLRKGGGEESKEEMLEFLRSEESLLAYSNGQELLAVANLFNMNIHIFTNEGREGSWSGVGPDPDMSFAAELKGNLSQISSFTTVKILITISW